jgi:Cu-processing system ATP-binding protein
MITILRLHKFFGKNHVLKGIDLVFDQPGVVAVLGPNGSGKTTLIKTILGMVLPEKGSIEVFGAPIRNKWSYRSQIAYLPQIARFPENLKVSELLDMVKDLRGAGAAEKPLIDLFELHPFIDKRLSNLSGGTRQKVNLVLTFMYDCPILILDEPTAGLDPVSIVRLKELIDTERAKGKIILVTTHVMSLVEELAERVVFLLEGNVHFKGTLSELKETYGDYKVERAIANLLQRQKGENANFSANGNCAIAVNLQPA